MFSIVIPHYNNKKLLKQCLASIKKTDTTELIDEIIVVDNGSTDGSVEFVKNFQKIKLIENRKNLGFAKAVNKGIKFSRAKWTIVLNNDIKLTPNWFKEIKKGVEKYKNKNLGFLFGKVLSWNGEKIESLGLDFHLCGKSVNIGNGQKNNPNKYKKEKELIAAPASAICFKKSAITKTGLFDQDFFAYLEDIDLCLRLRNQGFKGFFLPNAISHHMGGATADKIPGLRYKMTASNWWFIIIKYYPVSSFLKNIHLIIFEQAKNFFAVKNFSDKLWTIQRTIKKFPKMVKKRRPIKNLWQLSQKSKT